MAIRRPSISSPEWLFQDFLYQAIPGAEDRYVQVKRSEEPYTRVSQTFDYSNPPYSDSEQKGGNVVAQLDYTLTSGLVTITGWEVNWRDDWPLRLAMNYLAQCLYTSSRGFLVRAMGDEVYSKDGTSIPIPNKDPYAFLVSEQFMPVTNEPYDYLLR